MNGKDIVITTMIGETVKPLDWYYILFDKGYKVLDQWQVRDYTNEYGSMLTIEHAPTFFQRTFGEG